MTVIKTLPSGQPAPADEYGWTAYIAAALARVMYAKSLEEAKTIASERLLDFIDDEAGAGYIPYTTKLRFYAAAHQREQP